MFLWSMHKCPFDGGAIPIGRVPGSHALDLIVGASFANRISYEERKYIPMKMIGNIPVWGEHEEKTIGQIQTCAATADRAALMADGHLGYAVPIGGVVAYKDAISPSGVGFDIACGNKAVRVDMPAGELRANIAQIMDDVWRTVSFGVGRRNNEPFDHALFDDPAWKAQSAAPLKEMAPAT